MPPEGGERTNDPELLNLVAPFSRIPPNSALTLFITRSAIHAVIHEAACHRPELPRHPLFRVRAAAGSCSLPQVGKASGGRTRARRQRRLRDVSSPAVVYGRCAGSALRSGLCHPTLPTLSSRQAGADRDSGRSRRTSDDTAKGRFG